MNAENKELFAKCNLFEWHEAGYTGKGIKVAVWDDLPYAEEDMDYVTIPFAESSDKPTHATYVARCLHESAPDAEIYMLPCARNFEEGAKWMVNNGINIISCSTSSKREREYYPPYNFLKLADMPFFVAAGNENTEVSGLPAFDWTIAVGAATQKEQKEDYSNFGNSLDCLAYIPYIYANGIITKFNGTSFAQPFVAGMFACYAQFLKEQGKPCGRAAAAEFVRSCCKDIGEVGKDIVSGYGILTMPPLKKEAEEMDIIAYQYPFKSSFVFGTPYGRKGTLWKVGWHSGLDLLSTNYGGNGVIYPIAAGKVKAVAQSASYGNYVMVLHKDGYLSLYAHLAQVYVKAGDAVTLDTALGKEGSTGNSTGTHLHLEIHKGEYHYPAEIDPHEFIDNKIEEAEAMEREEIKAIVKECIAEHEAEQRNKPVSAWAADAWGKAKNKGLFDGTMPQAPLTREQAAVIAARKGEI